MQFGEDNWAEGNAYNDFMGRWSQLLAKRFPALAQTSFEPALVGYWLWHRRIVSGNTCINKTPIGYWL